MLTEEQLCQTCRHLVADDLLAVCTQQRVAGVYNIVQKTVLKHNQNDCQKNRGCHTLLTDHCTGCQIQVYLFVSVSRGVSRQQPLQQLLLAHHASACSNMQNILQLVDCTSKSSAPDDLYKLCTNILSRCPEFMSGGRYVRRLMFTTY
jgi:hypothetical protein